MRAATFSSKRLVAIVLAVLLVAAVALAAATSGLGQPSIPSGDIAVVEGVEDGTVSEEEFDRAFENASAELGLPKPPSEGDEAYETALNQAMLQVLQPIWLRGEAEERGITVSDEKIDKDLAEVKKREFSSAKEYQRFLEQSGFTEEEVRGQLELVALQDKFLKEVFPSQETRPNLDREELEGLYGIDAEAIEKYYESNKDLPPIAQDASRDVRVIINRSQAEVAKARRELEADDSKASWQRVAAKYSQDPASKSQGGLIENVTEQSSDPELAQQAFDAPVGELVGPFPTARGFGLLQVVDATEAGPVPLSDAQGDIRRVLLQSAQQQAGSDFQAELTDKWSDRTVCEPDKATQLCSNFEPPAPNRGDKQPDAPPVVSSSPLAPGTATFTGGAAGVGEEQTAKRVGDECAAPDEVEQATPPDVTAAPPIVDPCGPDDSDAQPPAASGLPSGAVPIGPDGAPAPQSAPPAGAAPPPAPPSATP